MSVQEEETIYTEIFREEREHSTFSKTEDTELNYGQGLYKELGA